MMTVMVQEVLVEVLSGSSSGSLLVVVVVLDGLDWCHGLVGG